MLPFRVDIDQKLKCFRIIYYPPQFSPVFSSICLLDRRRKYHVSYGYFYNRCHKNNDDMTFYVNDFFTQMCSLARHFFILLNRCRRCRLMFCLIKVMIQLGLNQKKTKPRQYVFNITSVTLYYKVLLVY